MSSALGAMNYGGFTAAERIAIKAARPGRQTFDDHLYLLKAAKNVFLDDPGLIAGLGLVGAALLRSESPAEIRA